MFSSACQGLQLCLEPKVVESHFLRLKLAPPISNFSGAIEAPPTEPDSMSHNDEKNSNITDDVNNKNNSNDCKLIGNQNTDKGCGSFIQSFAGPKDSTDNKEIYVHPLVKTHSPYILNEKSLELCTESLGSESGTGINDDIPFLSSGTACCNTSKPREDMVTRGMSRSSSFPPTLTSISGSTTGCCNPLSKGKENLVIRRMSRSSSFPPPLTSISGSNGVQVMSHREGGRLVLQAVNVRSCQAYFHAERSEGRLRLCLLKDTTPTTPILDDEDREDEEEQQEREQEERVEEDEVNGGVVEDEVVVHEENGVVEDGVVHEENGVVEDGFEEEKCPWGDEDVNGKSENVGGKIVKGEFARPSSCKDTGCGRKRFTDWEPYLVAT